MIDLYYAYVRYDVWLSYDYVRYDIWLCEVWMLGMDDNCEDMSLRILSFEVIYGHGDALCSRSQSLFTRFKRRRFRHIQDDLCEVGTDWKDEDL